MLNKSQIKEIQTQAIRDLNQVRDEQGLQTVETKYFGRKGILSGILRTLKSLPLLEKKALGADANQLRQMLRQKLLEKKQAMRSKFVTYDFDMTEPGTEFRLGHVHPLTQVRNEMETFFRNQGFAVIEGPEIETDYYNFEALNIPKDHPARDIWDTFWLNPDKKTLNGKERLLLRTHTSAMQVRLMEKRQPPLAIVVPGRTFRHEATDARHEHTFDQLEGFYVDRKVNAGHLKFILHQLFRHLFGKDVAIKLRPGYFPFTEPSFELVMSCPFCRQKGCKVCGAGWLEMLGAGMIHPRVFAAAGYKPGLWQGFAFGLGIARVAMLKFDIPDIRMLYQNDLRLLKQF